MASSLTEEKTYYLRLVALTIGIAPKAVRSYFNSVFPPLSLATELKKNEKKLKYLKISKKILTSAQWKKLFPTGSVNVSSNDFDLTLMVFLLRNLSGVTPPALGFDCLPSSTDIGKADDLARIKYFRNKIAHSDDGSMTKADFLTAWDNVSQAVERLGGLIYNQDCINLKNANLDSACYRDILLNISHSQDEKLKELTDKIENAVKVTDETKHALEDPVPATRRGIFREEIALWEEMDKKFVETYSSKELLKIMKSEDTIIITGNAGMGKTFLMRHIALQMKSDGYKVLPIIDPKDILTYTLPKGKTLYVIDDICGKYNVVQNLIEVWEYNSSEIKKSIGKSNCKILSNCRLQVFQSKQFQSLKILSQKQFNMLTSEYSLTTEEKRCIAMKYLRTEFAKKLSADIINQYDCFPLLCTLLPNKDEEKAMLFLKRPYEIFSKELDLLYNKADRLMYCALALVVAFNNSLCESVLVENVDKNVIEVFEDIFEACGESKSSSRQRVKENLDSLNSSYILKHDKRYSFIHPKIYEMAAYYFSKKPLLLNCMLNHCSAAYLCERFLFLSIADTNNEFQIELPPSLETTFFDRLMKNASGENILDIFGCKLMNYVEYRTSLISYMKTMNSDLKASLLRLSRNGLTIFHLMCKLGHTDVIRFCIDEKIEPNSYQDIGLTPLHTACKYEKEDVIDMLLTFGVNTNKYKSAGYTPLYEACKTGKTNVVRKLLMHEADPSLCSDKRLIPLLIATKKGHRGIVHLLLRYKADINQQDENGMSALHLASMTHNVDLLQFLIRVGANVDIKTNNEETPLYFACENAHADIVTLLITDNADVFNISTRTGLSPISVLLTNGKQDLANDILNNIPNKMLLYSALETASENNEVKLVDALLLTNIDINVILPSGNTALHVATKNGYFTLVKLLLYHGANINSQTQEGGTPIQLACLNGHEEIVSLLVSEGAKVNVSNINLFVLPPLHISCLLENKKMASTLINGNADLNETRMLTLQTMSELREHDYINSLFNNDDIEINGMVTPIEIVCMARDTVVLRYLLEKGADSNMKTVQYGIHPLLIACFYKESDMIDMLLNHRSNVNVYENIENMCLTHIMNHGEEDIIELIAYRRNEKTSSALTPLHIACVNGHVATVSSVLRFGARTDIATRVSPFIIFTLKQKSKTDMTCSTVNKYLKKYDEIENILPIHLCCFGGNPHIVESVVDNMTKMTEDLTIRVNALQIACLHGKFYKHRFGIEAQYYSLDPLQIACLGRHWDICKLLLNNGYDAFLEFDVSEFLVLCFTDTKSISATENNIKISKTSVIEFAYENKAHDLFKHILIATQRFKKSKECVFHKLFTSACANNEVDFAKLIFRKCVDRGDERQPSTLLNVACQHNRIDIVDFILSFSKEIEQSNDKSETALHITSMSGFEDLTLVLLKRGFNPFALTHAGENAFHLACKHNQVGCCSILLKYTDDHIYSIYTDTVHWTNIYTSEKKTTTSFALINKNETLLSILFDSGADINLPVGEENETLLFLACKEGCAVYVEYFLERSADVNLANCDGKTPLLIACGSGHDPITRQLLAANASVNVQANNGYCPLYYACDDNFEITKLLLEKKADPNCLIYDGAESFLIKAVKSRSHKTVELLLTYGSNVNYSLTPEQPALYFAFKAADSKMMKCLLRFNADQHVCCHERAKYLYLACNRGMFDIVELILFHDRNIDPNFDYVDGETSLFACYNGMNHTNKIADVVRYKQIGRLLIRFGADINKETKNNDTPFHQLCIKGAHNEIDYVLEKCNIKQEYILSEMMFAFNQGNITLFHSLIAHYHQPIQDEHFRDILFKAVETNQVEIINLLIERGIDTNITNNIRKHCALHIASSKGNIDVVKSILRQDNTILDMKSSIHGYTPLHVACSNGHVEICEILINNGANITEKTNTGKSLLQLAFHKSKVMSFLLSSNENEMSKQFQDEIVKFRLLYDQSNEDKEMFRQLIMISNTDFNVDDTDKCIHFACRNEDTDLIQQLITKNCDLNCVNEHGLTPLIISICKNNLENVELLLRGGVPVDENTLILHKGIEECLGTCIPSMANASPLHISCLKKYSKIVEQLVVRNAQLNSHMQVYYSLSAHDSDCEMLSPLFISVMKRDFETVRLLLKSNSDSGLLTFNSVFISSLFNDGTFVENEFFLDYRTDLSSFQAACILGYDDIVDEIIKYYPDINQKFKITPIFLSFFDESCELMHQFLSLYGYDNKDFEIEVTPLIFSVLVGNFKVLKTLLSNFANHEFESSFCLIHVVSLKRNILDILVSTYLEPQELLLSKCTLNALSIACLKNDAEICQLLLSKYADPLYATQLTAMHVICFRGYDSHLECIMELRLPVDRYFRIQCSHIIACSKFDDTNADDLILSSPGFNDVLDISIVELACFHNNVDFLINMIQIIPEQSYNSIMNVTPLFLSCLFGNDGQFQIGMFMSDMKLQSNIPYQMVISRLCISGYWTLRISDFIVYPLKTFTPRDNMKITNFSLLLKNYCLCICNNDDEDEDEMIKQTVKVSMGKMIPDPIACDEVNLLILLLLDLRTEDNIYIMYTASKLLQNIDVCIKVFKLNFTYLLLLKNVSLELLPVSTYSELSQKPLSFTAVEAFYLIHRLIPDSLFLSTEAKYQTLEIDPILIACLHENIPNVEFILRRNADINSLNELSLLLLTSFQYNEFDNKLIQSISYQTLVAKINPLHVAILAENIEMTKVLLANGCCVNTSAFLTPFHICVMKKKMTNNSDLVYDDLLTPFLDTVIAGENIDSMCVSIEMKPIHIACFYTENIDFVRILFGRHNCNLKSAAKLSTVVLYFINQDEDFEIALNHNTLEAVSDLTPLNIACLLNNTSLVEYLLTKQIEVDSIGSIFPHHMNFSHCSDIAELITIQSEFILTSLHIALLNDNEDVVGLLIEYGANVDISISLIIELNIGNMYISTHSSLKAIHLACLIDNDNIFGTILSKTTFIDEKCAVSLWHLCYLKVVSGVKMYETFDREIELNLNPMHIFCIIGDCAHVEMLLNADANCNLAAEMPLVYTKINSTACLYKFPLHLAAESGNLEMCTLLLKHNADNEVKTNVIGFKPWHLALYHGHVDVLKHLLTVRTTIRKSLFMFTLFLFILRVRYGNIVIQFIAKSKNVIPLLSFYRYLLNVFGFSLIP